MSIYLSHTNSLNKQEKRKAFFYKNGKWITYRSEFQIMLCKIDDPLDNPIECILPHLSYEGKPEPAILLPPLNDNQLNEALQLITDFVALNNMDVHLLTNDSKFIKEHLELLKSFNVICDIPKTKKEIKMPPLVK